MNANLDLRHFTENERSAIPNLDVRLFLASPRHAYQFRVSQVEQDKVRRRLQALRRGENLDKMPIVNIQTDEHFNELHDGNATAIAWLIYAKENNIPPMLNEFAKKVKQVIVLRNRVHISEGTWHPYVPLHVAEKTRNQLRKVSDPEKNNEETCVAETENGVPAYFDELSFFDGVDRSERLGQIAFGLQYNVAPDGEASP